MNWKKFVNKSTTESSNPKQEFSREEIEKIVTMTNWDYYEAIQRFQRILEAEGIIAELKENGAIEGDLVMIGDWDFNFWERTTKWVSDLGMENINPRQRPKVYDD